MNDSSVGSVEIFHIHHTPLLIVEHTLPSFLLTAMGGAARTPLLRHDSQKSLPRMKPVTLACWETQRCGRRIAKKNLLHGCNATVATVPACLANAALLTLSKVSNSRIRSARFSQIQKDYW